MRESACSLARGGRRLAISGEHIVFDHKRRLEVSAWTIHGLKKTVFNATDYGTVVISTFSQAHT